MGQPLFFTYAIVTNGHSFGGRARDPLPFHSTSSPLLSIQCNFAGLCNWFTSTTWENRLGVKVFAFHSFEHNKNIQRVFVGKFAANVDEGEENGNRQHTIELVRSLQCSCCSFGCCNNSCHSFFSLSPHISLLLLLLARVLSLIVSIRSKIILILNLIYFINENCSLIAMSYCWRELQNFISTQ